MGVIVFAATAVTALGSAFSGDGYIAGESPDGLVKVDGTPAAREVRIHERVSGRLVATTMSASNGTYAIYRLDRQVEFDVIARDHERVWADRIVGAVIPAAM